LLLALALALGLAVPAMAEDESGTITKTVNSPDMPSGASIAITRPVDYSVPYNTSFIISAEVTAPPEMEVSLQWEYLLYPSYSRIFAIEDATEPELTVTPGTPYYPIKNGNRSDLEFIMGYRLIAAFTWEDEGSVVVTCPMHIIQMSIPYVEQQSYRIDVPYGADAVIDARLELPPGVEATYEWRTGSSYGRNLIEGTDGPVLILRPGDPEYPQLNNNLLVRLVNRYTPAYKSYCYRATVTVRDEHGEVIDAFIHFPFNDYGVSIEPQRPLSFFEQSLVRLFLLPPFAALATPWLILAGSIAFIVPIMFLPITFPLSFLFIPFVGVYSFFSNLVDIIRTLLSPVTDWLADLLDRNGWLL